MTTVTKNFDKVGEYATPAEAIEVASKLKGGLVKIKIDGLLVYEAYHHEDHKGGLFQNGHLNQ